MFYTFHGSKQAICGAEVVIVALFYVMRIIVLCLLESFRREAKVLTVRVALSLRRSGIVCTPARENCGYAACFCLTYLFRKANDQAILRLAHQRLEEILAAGGQHGPVPAELLALHQDSHIAQDILLPLVVQAEEDIGTMNRRLIHIHGGFRLLIYGHSAHALEIEAQQRGVSLQAQLSERIPHG